ncbi:4-hydroxythreonine-4-phosphate dehydrogenase PdxA [Methylocapsa sp. S129]|uniref:4-hydroxythreonine-4-phosphate dehydrogenase PdxA n=1 Tax=Methylocapsa sp. S129 TaxID=1641869 RepID=UPI00131E8D9C|nr:4-hydroxythreonine-4-phosphate dehydrogenase PdxA [Methylocapsa sp. S129]
MTSDATTQKPRLPLAMSMGEPAGIGPELALRAWLRRAEIGAPFFVVADPAALNELARRLALEVPIAIVEPGHAAQTFDKALPVVPLAASAAATPGEPDSAFARATIESIERTVGYVRSGEAGAVVTNPIAKHVLYEAGFAFPGHTEFLGALAQQWGARAQPVMMLWSRELSVAPVTIHIPLADVPRTLTRALIVSTARIVAADLRDRFGVARPRLAVAGLNPHAGEGGAIGREEIEIIIPAIAQLRAEGLEITGPHPADTMFHAAARARYDVALVMYHDQGLIPIKTLAFDTGVNVTLGLPFIRTSPDHGTAFDIAGKGLANPTSLIEAARLAARLAAA